MQRKLLHFTLSHPKLSSRSIKCPYYSLNKILPEMCEAPGFKLKAANSLRVNCFPSLFNGGMEEKLIRERSGHRSDALFQYAKTTEENVFPSFSAVSCLSCYTTEKQDESLAFKDVVFQKGNFQNCTINVTVSKKE